MVPAEEYRARVQRALDFARSHLNENPTLSDLAAAAAFSPFHFHRIFAAFTGETPAEHLRRLRLEKAANELRYRPTTPVTEIALGCGFATPSAFSRDFRARFGVSPRAYREGKDAKNREQRRDPPEPTGSQEFRYEDLPAMRLAFCPHVGPYGPGIGAAWGTLMGWAGPRGFLGPGALLYGVSWDNPEVTEGHKLRYDACLVVPPGTEASGPVSVRDLRPYRCIVLPFRGPERRFSQAYRRLYYGILPRSGCEPEDFPALERYLSPPRGILFRRFDAEIHLPVRPLR